MFSSFSTPFFALCAMPKDANSNGACPKDDLSYKSESQLFFYRKESGLESFVPNSLAESMKRKELKKLLGHFLKMNTNLTAPGQKNLTALQAKLHYLKIISELPSYGAKCFSTTLSVSISHQRNQSSFTRFLLITQHQIRKQRDRVTKNQTFCYWSVLTYLTLLESDQKTPCSMKHFLLSFWRDFTQNSYFENLFFTIIRL